MHTPSRRRAPAPPALYLFGALGALIAATGCGGPDANGRDGGTDAPTGPVVRLLVDSDRDGEPSASDADRAHRTEFTAEFGPVFLANVDDDDEDHAVDAQDETVNGPEDENDLARVRVDAWASAPEGATGSVALGAAAGPHVHLFKHAADGAWTLFDPATARLTAAELRAGVELGIESLAFPTSEWDGAAELTLTVTDAAGTSVGTDRVVLHTAPFVLGNPVAPTLRVYSASASGFRPSDVFVRDLDRITTADQMDYITFDALDDAYVTSEQGPDVWAEDIMEFGWTAMPRAGGMTQSMHAVLRSAQYRRPVTLVTQREVMAHDVGYTWQRSTPEPTGRAFDSSLDSFGNLEPTPPYRTATANFPLGRIIYGRTTARHGDPAVLGFLEAQRVQGPVLQLDTSWLLVGHVDESLNFVPATNTPRGWKLLFASTRLARTVLSDIVAMAPGNADLVMFEGQSWYDHTPGPNEGQPYPARRTIGSLLADTELMAFNQQVQARLDAQRAMLQTELGLADSDIVEIPFLFQDEELGMAGAMMPGTVNLLAYNRTVIPPRPHGAVVNGVDLIERDFVARVMPLGLTVQFAEQWDLLHAANGEVHCGTNAVRQIPTGGRWWEGIR